MGQPATIVHVNVESFDGQEEGDVGYSYYVANSPELRFTTDGKTFEELLANVQECLYWCLIESDSLAEYGVAPSVRVQMIMELNIHNPQTA